MFRLAGTFLLILVCTLAAPARAETELTVTADKPDCIYSLGDTVTYTVICPDKKAVVDYTLTIDGRTELEKGTLEFKKGKATVRGTLDQPGFLRLTVSTGKGEEQVRQYWGCAFEPLAIRATGSLPDDFERFWAQGKAELLRVAPRFPDRGNLRRRAPLQTLQGQRRQYRGQPHVLLVQGASGRWPVPGRAGYSRRRRA